MTTQRHHHTPGIVLREDVRPSDADAVMAVAASSGFFSEDEVAMAGDLVRERLRDGEASGYFFVFAHAQAPGAAVAGFACHGPAEDAPGWTDLYWLAVHGALRGRGIGSMLLRAVEAATCGPRSATLRAETSSRGQYRPTRAFYAAKGFELIHTTRDHYAPGEHMLVYAKRLDALRSGGPGTPAQRTGTQETT